MKKSLLQDRFLRTVSYLRVSITDRCNQRCIYCMPAEGVPPLDPSDILSYEEILRVIKVAANLGINKIRITGGEPLVRKGVAEFISKAAAIDGVDELALTTNGLLLEDMASELKSAGLKRVNVSLDTLNPEKFEFITRRKGPEQVLKGIEAAKSVGLSPVKINVVAIKGINDGEILDFADLAVKGGYEVRFIEFMPTTNKFWSKDRLLKASEILDILKSKYSLDASACDVSSGPSRCFALPGGAVVGVISPISDHFCGNCNRLRLTAEGSLRSCLFSDSEEDLSSMLRSGADDSMLAEAICRAVNQKPSGHALSDPAADSSKPEMGKIGG